MVGGFLPLIPALSLGERENHRRCANQFRRGVLHCNSPPFGFRRMAQRIDRAGARVEQRAGDAGLAEEFGGALDGVAFPNRPQIEHHALAGELDGEILRVQVDQVHAHLGARLGQFLGTGQMAGAAHEAPAPDQRRDGDVESPVRLRG